ncbi:sensor histidine kinase [Oceanospirillum sediminis]|uniref:histidine kinase n=1 Tax=Oceanospirillum sediminis TaxID=2760088 RepID=A0A839IY21_9GAMM|nr:sensor histidine kinase [Oceanospirillum sediminis]MBB1489580.1 sensor histidine kinase [Oceanospirillum sediminis]
MNYSNNLINRQYIFLRAALVALLLTTILSTLAHARNNQPPYHADNHQILTLSPGTGSYSLYGYLQHLPGVTANQTFSQTVQAFQEKQFIPVNGFLNLGYTLQTSWVSFSLKLPEDNPEQYILWLSPYMLNFIDIYVQEGTDELNPEHYRHYAFGDNRPVNTQTLRHSRHLLPLDMIPGKSYRLFIRTQTTSSHVLRAWIRTEAETISESNTHIIWLAAFVACALLLGAIALLQAIRLKSRIQFWYGCYLLSEACTQIGMQGFLPLLIPEYAHLIADWLTGSGAAGVYLSMSCIIIHILNTQQDHPWFHRYLTLLIALACLTFPLSGTEGYIPIQYLLVPMGLFVMPVSTVLYFRKNPAFDRSQRLFFLFFLICSTGITVHLLRLAGILPVNELTFGAMMLIAVLHMLLLNLALSEKLLDAEQKARYAAERSESRAIDLAKEMTRELVASKQNLETALSKEQQALKEQSRFLDMISHEYRTPLAIIRTNLDILDLKLETENNSQNNLKAMFTATRRLQEIFDTQLRKGEISYQITPEKQRTDAAQLITDIFADASSLWSDQNINLINDSEGRIQLDADPALIKTLIFNLLDNAMKYSPADSQINCRLSKLPGSHLQLTVCNPLCSTDSIEIDQLCDKYVRGSNSSGSSGLGLGLYLIKRIAQVHDGQLNISLPDQQHFQAELILPLCSAIETEVSEYGQ